MHAGQKPVGRTDVGEHGQIEIARQREPPLAHPRAGASGRTLAGVVEFEIVRVEMSGLAGAERKRHDLVVAAAVVARLDADVARVAGAVHHSHNTLATGRVRGRREQRHDVFAAVRFARHRR